MLCEKCGKHEANSHFKSNWGGAVTERHLCSDCAREEGFLGGSAGFAGLLGAFLGHAPAARESRCPRCGTRWSDIANSGRVGCEHCYSAFSRELSPTIENMFGRSTHRGKVARGAAAQGSPPAQAEGGGEKAPSPGPEDKIQALRAELSRAIAAEQYERAAALRDEIRGEEAGLHG